MNILVAQTLFPGDLVLTTPLLQHLRSEFPGVGITVLVERGLEGLLEGHPAISSVMTFDKARGVDSMFGTLTMSETLRKRRFSLAIVLPGSVRTALAVYLAGIRRRIGTNMSSGVLLFEDRLKHVEELERSRDGRWILRLEKGWRAVGGTRSFVTTFFTDVVDLDRGKTAIERHLQLLQPLKIAVRQDLLRPRLFPSSRDVQAVDEFLSGHDGKQTIALAPGSRWPTKRWSGHSYAVLATALSNRGFLVVIVGGDGDQELASAIHAATPPGTSVNAAGQLSLLQSAELVKRCRLLIGNDSAPVHLAAAMGTPTVTLLGPTVTDFGFVPGGMDHHVLEIGDLSCRPCTPFGGDRCPIGTHECMERITPEQVLKNVDALLDGAETMRRFR